MEVIHLRQVVEDNIRASSWMVVESNRRYPDLHAVVGNAVRVLSPPAPTGMTLVDHLHTVSPWVMDVATYCILLGAAT
jgi:hypothetical protein